MLPKTKEELSAEFRKVLSEIDTLSAEDISDLAEKIKLFSQPLYDYLIDLAEKRGAVE